jgi:uncharacterized protein YggL (DUF469 family)
MTKSRSKRLRKKLHVGEFTEYGFNINFELNKPVTDEEIDDFLDTFLDDVIEKNGLIYGGGFGVTFDGFVILEKRGSPTEEHRQLIKTWLESKKEIRIFHIGEFVNAWHDK